MIFTLCEGVDISLPEEYKQQFENNEQGFLSQGTEFGVADSVCASSSQQTENISSQYTGSIRQHASRGSYKITSRNRVQVSSRDLPYALLDFDKSQVLVKPVSGTLENPLWAGDSTLFTFDVSRVTELVVGFYIRDPHARLGSRRSQDICNGAVQIDPWLEKSHKYAESPKLSKKDAENTPVKFDEEERIFASKWCGMAGRSIWHRKGSYRH